MSPRGVLRVSETFLHTRKLLKTDMFKKNANCYHAKVMRAGVAGGLPSSPGVVKEAGHAGLDANNTDKRHEGIIESQTHDKIFRYVKSGLPQEKRPKY